MLTAVQLQSQQSCAWQLLEGSFWLAVEVTQLSMLQKRCAGEFSWYACLQEP